MSEKFLTIGVEERLAQALAQMGITEPTPVQNLTIPAALAGNHIIGQSATGTGKTFAYLLPLLQKIVPARQNAQAVILAPTYELAMQIYRQLEILIKTAALEVSSCSLIGGANVTRQMEKLKKKPQVLVGSAGRMIELQRKGKLKLDQVHTVVLDEVDRLLDDQNLATTKFVVGAVPSGAQYLLFSATISPRTVNRADFVKDPHIVSLKEDTIAKPDIENLYFVADFRDKVEVLRKLVKILGIKRGLVFVNRNEAISVAVEKLKFHGVKVAALNGEGSKMERKTAIEDFTKGKIELLVASDVAARGLDIVDIDYVINLDLPEDEKIYLHRTGRTGRAGKSGIAVSLVAPQEIVKLSDFAKKIKVELWQKQMENGKVVDFRHRPRPARRTTVKKKDLRQIKK